MKFSRYIKKKCTIFMDKKTPTSSYLRFACKNLAVSMNNQSVALPTMKGQCQQQVLHWVTGSDPDC